MVQSEKVINKGNTLKHKGQPKRNLPRKVIRGNYNCWTWSSKDQIIVFFVLWMGRTK